MRWFLLFILFSYAAIADFNLSKELQEKETKIHQIRIKNIVSFQGIRDNLLIGYGLVTELSGTGDNLRNSAFTQRELEGFLGRVGVNTIGANIKTKNTAAVTITATLPPFIKNGNRINVTVSTLGDATNLSGGVLLATPLMGANGEVYAIAQGEISIAGIEPKRRSGNSNRGVKTAGFITNGAIVEREIPFSLDGVKELTLSLHNPDISTASYIAAVINANISEKIAKASSPATVSLHIPKEYDGRIMDLLTEVEQLQITPDNSAKIIIDESSGTIVMGQDVRVSTVAIAQGNLSMNITEDVTTLERGASLQDLVNGLNALGVPTRDLIGILQNIKSIGALQGEIIVK